MKNALKKPMLLLIALVMTLSSINLIACKKNQSATDFYEVVHETQEYLDIVADEIYDNWYNAIYNDYYGGDINWAITSALSSNEENISTIKANDEKIKELYKEAKDTDFEEEVKAVMSAYSEYYELVINVSGSFNTYKDSKETLKKALSSALKELEMEL